MDTYEAVNYVNELVLDGEATLEELCNEYNITMEQATDFNYIPYLEEVVSNVRYDLDEFLPYVNLRMSHGTFTLDQLLVEFSHYYKNELLAGKSREQLEAMLLEDFIDYIRDDLSIDAVVIGDGLERFPEDFFQELSYYDFEFVNCILDHSAVDVGMLQTIVFDSCTFKSLSLLEAVEDYTTVEFVNCVGVDESILDGKDVTIIRR